MPRNPHLEKCVNKIIDQTRWGDPHEWTHQRFSDLSNLILEKTGVLISVSSLKRIFGKVSSDHEPQKGTRNALAQFMEYTDWDDFTSRNPLTFTEKSNEKASAPITKRRKSCLISAGVIIAGIILTIFFIIIPDKNDLAGISFTGKYLTGTSPHTVVFNYNIKKTKDSVYINYDDDFSEIKQEALNHELNTITHRYILPDLYKITLVHKGNILKTLNVNLETNGWQTYLGNDNRTKFYPFDSEKETGRLEVDPEKVFSTGFLKREENVLVKYRLVKDFGIAGENCKLKVRVADLKKIKSLECFFASFVIHGDSGKINVTFAQKDCITKAVLRFGDSILDGRYSDLSALSANFSDWQDIEMSVENHNLAILINGQQRINLPFPVTLGRIRVILFDSPLSGALDYIELTDTKTGNMYSDTF